MTDCIVQSTSTIWEHTPSPLFFFVVQVHGPSSHVVELSGHVLGALRSVCNARGTRQSPPPHPLPQILPLKKIPVRDQRPTLSVAR